MGISTILSSFGMKIQFSLSEVFLSLLLTEREFSGISYCPFSQSERKSRKRNFDASEGIYWSPWYPGVGTYIGAPFYDNNS